MGTLHEVVFTFMTISRSVLLRMRKVVDKSCRENKNTHFMFSNVFRKSCRLWDNVEEYGGASGATNDVTIWRIPVASWISKATYTHAHKHAHAPRHTHESAHAHKYVISSLLLYHYNDDSQMRLSVTLYVHCLSCVLYVGWQTWRCAQKCGWMAVTFVRF
jgi:hypothetical protein